ncbi:MAG: S41 family peptidase [Thermaurantimonas sp.]
MKKNALLLLIAILTVLSGCQKNERHTFPEFYLDDPFGNFMAFWDGMSKNYGFWGYDTVNWDQKLEYLDQITDSTTDEELASIFKKMIRNLIDHHYGIFANIDGNDLVIVSQKVKENLSKIIDVFEDGYFEFAVFNRLSSSDRNKFDGYVYGTINNNIQYVRLPGFSLSMNLDDPKYNQLINFIENPKPNHKGIIFDVRHNGGGLASDLQLLVGTFTKDKTLIGHARQKVGSGRFDYSPWFPIEINPGKKFNPLPVVILCDNISISMAEAFTMAMAVLPQVTTVGTTTFGAHGPLLFQNTTTMITGSRSFYLPNGWRVQLALEVFRPIIEGKVLEGIGYTPEVILPLDVQALDNNGSDNQLDKAIDLLK